MTQHTITLLAGMALAAAVAGCHRTPQAPIAPPHHVQGKVVFADKTPLRGGVIVFVPVEAKAGGGLVRYECENLVDAKGAYKMGLNGNDQGVPAGEYKVTVKPRDINEVRNSNSNRIPTKYRDASKTPLACTVKEGENTIDFELK
jgi:hypothetical protein